MSIRGCTRPLIPVTRRTSLEAAFCGTPTLAMARGSMPEVIEVGRTGMLVEGFVEGYHQITRCFEMDRAYRATRASALQLQDDDEAVPTRLRAPLRDLPDPP